MQKRYSLSLIGFVFIFLSSCTEENKNKTKPDDPLYTEIHEQYRLTDVNSLIDINNENDVDIVRKELIRVVFGNSQLHTDIIPLSVKTDIFDPEYSDILSLKRIDTLKLDMPYGINSVAYLFHAIDSNSQLVIYHQGHGGDFKHGKKTINELLSRGYDVIAIAMPLRGKNSRPRVKIKGVGMISLQNHEWMRFLEYPLSYFMNPIRSAVQYGLVKNKYKSVSLIGLSGGGWAVTLYAALDNRIKNTYQVGGTMPYYLRSPITNKYYGHIGDYEQNYLPLIQAANYLELYILGSAGQGRKEVQIINQYDKVAAYGVKYRTYESVVKDKISKIATGGSFGVLLDTKNPDHTISQTSLKYILDDLDETFALKGRIKKNANKTNLPAPFIASY